MGYIKNLFTNKGKLIETIEAQEEMIDNLLELTDQLKEKAAKLEQELIKKKQKRRPQLTTRAGFSHVSKEEKAEFVERFHRGEQIGHIAIVTKRSPATVSKYIREELGEE